MCERDVYRFLSFFICYGMNPPVVSINKTLNTVPPNYKDYGFLHNCASSRFEDIITMS